MPVGHANGPGRARERAGRVDGKQHAEQDRFHALAAAWLQLPLVLKFHPDHYAVQFIFGYRVQSNNIPATYQKAGKFSMLRAILTWFSISCAFAVMPASAQTPSLSLYAAGSLRLAFDEIIALHAMRTGSRFSPTYGPSGKLREEIEKFLTNMKELRKKCLMRKLT